MNRKTILLAFAFAAFFAAGMAVMYVWTQREAAREETPLPPQTPSASLLTVDMENASAPEGVVEAEEAPRYADGSHIPSHLSKIKVEGMTDIVPPSEMDGREEENAVRPAPSVVLPEGVQSLSPGTAAARPAALPEDSKITMINAPVKARLIKSLEEYKAFKRLARGKYPQADFKKEMVVILESDSNLPDKVFEIQDVQVKDAKLTVNYRVNIFDLDSKINTHSAKTVKKSSLPLELRQVL